MEIAKIFKNNADWVSKKLSLEPNYFQHLSTGQNPELLYIGCSDSRVTAEEIMGAKPGQVFVHRNIANLVPNNDLSIMSTIVYAIKFLKVKNIIVCGHYHCGGLKAAMQSKDLGILNPWLRNIRDVYRLHYTELNNIIDEDKRYKRFVELNVQEQCINVIKTAEVQKAFHLSNLRVHGWVFDIETGKLIDLKINFEQLLKKIMQIYRLN